MLADDWRQSFALAEQEEHGVLAGTWRLDLDVPAPGSRAREPRHHAGVHVGVLELADQLEYLVGVVLDRGDPEREISRHARAQAGLGRQHLGVAGPRRGEHDPVLATAIAAKLDLVFSLRGPLVTEAGVLVPAAELDGALLDVTGPHVQRAPGLIAQAHRPVLPAEPLDDLHGLVVEGDDGAPDRRQLLRLGM